MSKMLELTAAYDSTDPRLTEYKPVKVLVDVSAIQSVTMGQEESRFCRVALVPSLPAYGESEDGESAVQDQRVLHVYEPYHEIRQILEAERGVVRCVQTK